MDTTALSELSLDLANQSTSSTLVEYSIVEPPNVDLKPKRKYKKRPKFKSKMITGYIIYASEIRKDFVKKYPDKDFGFISKLVGLEWKGLPQEVKTAYEKRAQEHNAKSKALMVNAEFLANLSKSPNDKPSQQNHQEQQQQPNAPQRTLQVIYQKQEQMIQTTTMVHHYGQDQPILIEHQQQASYFRQPAQPVNSQLVSNQESNNNEIGHNLTNGTCSVPAKLIRSNIVYRKPSGIKLPSKETGTQTDPIQWASQESKNSCSKKLSYSQKFRDYLINSRVVNHNDNTSLNSM